MKIRTVIGAASAAFAIAILAPASAHDAGEKSHAALRAGDTQHSEQITDRSGRSTIRRVGPRLRMPTQNRPSSTPTSFPEGWSRR
jgi:hypothetical protein